MSSVRTAARTDTDPTGFATLVGFLTALYLMSGRSRFSRILADSGTGIGSEVRVWILVAFAGILLWPRDSRHGIPRFQSIATGGMVSITLLLCYVIASAFWASNAELAVHKGYETFVVLAATTLLYVSLCTGNVDMIMLRFWESIFALAGLLALAAIPQIRSADFERLAVLGGGPNVFGRLMALWGIAGLYLARRPGRSPLYALALPLGLLLLVLSGSRGAMVAVAAGLFVFLLADRISPRTLALALLSTVLVAAVIFYFTPVGKMAVDLYTYRFVELTLLQRHSAGRTDLYNFAIQLGLAHPIFGAGLAGFFATGVDSYPHNFFLELFSETGVVGLVLALAMLWQLAVVAFRVDAATLSAFAVILVATQFSGDLYDSRGIFVFLLLGLTSATLARRHVAPAHVTTPTPGLLPEPHGGPISGGVHP